MGKYEIFLICLFFINFPNASLLTEDEFYDYLLAFVEGFSSQGEGKCLKLLNDTYTRYITTPIIADIVENYINITRTIKKPKIGLASDIFANYKLFFELEEDCHLSELVTVFVAFNCDDIMEEKIQLIGEQAKKANIFKWDVN